MLDQVTLSHASPPNTKASNPNKCPASRLFSVPFSTVQHVMSLAWFPAPGAEETTKPNNSVKWSGGTYCCSSGKAADH
jgi:hypothetical protein